MKEYIVLSKSDLNDLENEVVNLLNDGWELAGGISIAYKHEHGEERHIPGHLVYVQAMLKENG